MNRVDKIETLEEFRHRTREFSRNSLSVGGDFWTNSNLTNKVDEQGKLKEYCGNTMVFLLDDGCMDQLKDIQRNLYQNCARMLADSLRCDTFHITLHDLVNGMRSEKLSDEMEKSEQSALQLLAKIKEADPQKIKMRSTFLFNMVNTSVVLGFEPADEKSCRSLMKLYEVFQDVVYLTYPLTPHITMAYYKPGKYVTEDLEALQKTIEYVDRLTKVELELNTEKLVYQRFTDMNHYQIRE